MNCPKCQTETSYKTAGSLAMMTSCGHVLSIDKLPPNGTVTALVETPKDEYFDRLWPYQKAGVDFIKKSNFRCLIADEMGLGKTIQALIAIRQNFEQLTPTLYVVKSAPKYQWRVEIEKWLKDPADPLKNIAQVIDNPNSEILPLAHTIISMDMLDKFKEKIVARGFRAIVVDESQNFKALKSQRTTALDEIIEETGITNLIFLTGTPVLNRASEFYTTLNWLRPQDFSSYKRFVWDWCDSNRKGTNVGGIVGYRQEEFQKRISHYVLRREKRDVLKDLPPFRRNYEWITIEDDMLKRSYNAQLDQLNAFMGTLGSLKAEKQATIGLLGYLEKLRQITALSKIPWIVDCVEQFLEAEPNKKIVIGLHHEIVFEMLRNQLSASVITITGKDSAGQKWQKTQDFQTDPAKRVLLASILAAGEGLDGLQKASSTMITVERQWNLGKEAQFEARLDRIGQTEPVSNTYLLAKGTVDEYFTEMVLEKEDYVLSTITPEKRAERMEKHAASLNFMELAQKCLDGRL